MSLSNMIVYNTWVKKAYYETLTQVMEVFNGAGNGTLRLGGKLGLNAGDFEEFSFFEQPGDLVLDRNPYGNAVVPEEELAEKDGVSVKVSRTTPVMKWTGAQFIHNMKDPATAGIIFGRALAEQVLQKWVNTSLGICVSVLSAIPALIHDATALASPEDQMNFKNVTLGTSKFGDRGSLVNTFFMHSAKMYELRLLGLTNVSQLFTFGTVNIAKGPFGETFVVTDSPSLVDTTGATPVYKTLGLVPGALTIESNGDFLSSLVEDNSRENIIYRRKAEWSDQFSVLGHKWSKGTGGVAPNSAALLAAPSWERNMNDDKNMPGVLIETN